MSDLIKLKNDEKLELYLTVIRFRLEVFNLIAYLSSTTAANVYLAQIENTKNLIGFK